MSARPRPHATMRPAMGEVGAPWRLDVKRGRSARVSPDRRRSRHAAGHRQGSRASARQPVLSYSRERGAVAAGRRAAAARRCTCRRSTGIIRRSSSTSRTSCRWTPCAAPRASRPNATRSASRASSSKACTAGSSPRLRRGRARPRHLGDMPLDAPLVPTTGAPLHGGHHPPAHALDSGWPAPPGLSAAAAGGPVRPRQRPRGRAPDGDRTMGRHDRI
jgi:hypothetical protein